MKESTGNFLLGLLFAFILGAVAGVWTQTLTLNYVEGAWEMIEECEAELPRSKRCEIVAEARIAE